MVDMIKAYEPSSCLLQEVMKEDCRVEELVHIRKTLNCQEEWCRLEHHFRHYLEALIRYSETNLPFG